ncbi:MAG: TIR domain-containing protein [Polyangiaceae bacterium]|nr:TIR domain-containing protein [Polyangiaceae bacterium]
MATNVFVSFDHDDYQQVNGFKALVQNPNHPLDFRDHSLKEPVTDRAGKPLTYPPSDPRSKPVRDEIISKFQNASKLVVLIGPSTHTSEWVTWEIDTFFAMKQPLARENTWKRIRGMFLKGHDTATPPGALMNGRSTKMLAWDPKALDQWLDQDPGS